MGAVFGSGGFGGTGGPAGQAPLLADLTDPALGGKPALGSGDDQQLVAVALAAVLRLAGHIEPGEIVASVLGAAMLTVLIFNPLPRSVPLFPVGDGWAASTTLWGFLAVAAATLVVATSRDPYQRKDQPRQP